MDIKEEEEEERMRLLRASDHFAWHEQHSHAFGQGARNGTTNGVILNVETIDNTNDCFGE